MKIYGLHSRQLQSEDTSDLLSSLRSWMSEKIFKALKCLDFCPKVKVNIEEEEVIDIVFNTSDCDIYWIRTEVDLLNFRENRNRCPKHGF